MKKERKLPPYIKPSPPCCCKVNLLGVKRLVIIVRSDRCYIEAINGGEDYLDLKDFRLSLKFAGCIKIPLGLQCGNS